MTRQFLDLGSDSDWLKEFSHAARPIRSDVTSVWNFCARFSDVISRKTSGSVAEFRGFPLAGFNYTQQLICYSVKATGKLILTANYNLYFTASCIVVTCVCLTSVESSMLHAYKGEEKLATNITIA